MENNFKFQIVWMNPADLVPYVNNAKTHPDDQIDKIAHQIMKFGFDQPIVVNKEKVIIKGHGRRLGAMKLKLDSVPVIVREDISEHDEMALRMADNKVAESDYDKDLLKFELGTLSRADYDMTFTGYDDKELKRLLDDLAESDPGAMPNPGGEPAKQYILTIELKTEAELAELYQQFKDKGYNCTMIA